MIYQIAGFRTIILFAVVKKGLKKSMLYRLTHYFPGLYSRFEFSDDSRLKLGSLNTLNVRNAQKQHRPSIPYGLRQNWGLVHLRIFIFYEHYEKYSQDLKQSLTLP